MKILRLYLSKYKNLELSDIREIDINFTTMLTLILGANGSGKSSLLREATPLPAVSANYHTGGVKEIELECNGLKYVLRSVLGRSPNHSFLKESEDGTMVECNPGGTQSIQKELVEKELRFTPYLQRLLNGELQFTEMSPLARQDALTEISDLKLNYALGLYGRLKASRRDVVGALKHVNGKIEEAETELLAMGDVETLGLESDKIQRELRELLPLSVNVAPDVGRLAMLCQNSMSRLNKISASYIVNRKVVKHLGYRSVEEATEALDINAKEAYVVSSDIERNLQTIDDLGRLTNIVEANDGDVDVLIKRRDVLKKSLQAIGGGDVTIAFDAPLDVVATDMAVASKSLYDAYVSKDVNMTQCDNATYKECFERIYALKHDLSSGDSVARRLEKRIGDLEATLELNTNCPKCDTLIPADVNATPENISSLKHKLKETQVKNDELAERLSAQESMYESYGAYVAYYKHIAGLVSGFSTLVPLWRTFGTMQELVIDVSAVVSKLDKEHRRLSAVVNNKAIEVELKELEDTIQLHRVALESNACQRKSSAESALEEAYVRQDELSKRKEAIQNTVNEYRRLADMEKTYVDEFNSFKLHFVEWANASCQEGATTRVSELQNRLGTIQVIVNKKDQVAENIKLLHQDQRELNTKLKDLTVLITELSPKEGVIAEQMYGFVSGFMSKVNSIVDKIWSYTLEVGDCGFEDKGLDYKFPLIVNGESGGELKLGSTGQKDVINFAFTIVMMGYMGLKEYPLYMDEVGSSFDKTHRSNLNKYVKLLIDSRFCSNIFSISHYSDSFGEFSNVSVVALSEDDPLLPDNTNADTRIVRM